MTSKLPPLLVAAGLALGVATNANAILWDLETIALTGSATSVSQTESGVTLTILRPGSDFQIVDLSGVGAPASFGQRTLSPFTNPAAIPFIANFSSAISGISIDYGDFTPSDIDTVTIEAFSGPNATGALLASATSAPCCSIGGGFETQTLGLAFTGGLSVRFIGGSAVFPNSLFFDNFTASPPPLIVPEPGSLALLAIGIAGLAALRRRKA